MYFDTPCVFEAPEMFCTGAEMEIHQQVYLAVRSLFLLNEKRNCWSNFHDLRYCYRLPDTNMMKDGILSEVTKLYGGSRIVDLIGIRGVSFLAYFSYLFKCIQPAFNYWANKVNFVTVYTILFQKIEVSSTDITDSSSYHSDRQINKGFNSYTCILLVRVQLKPHLLF